MSQSFFAPAAALALAATLGASLPAYAQQPGRFMMDRTDDGYVRLDTQTGEISVCRSDGGQIVCRMAADQRAAFEDELDRLEARIAALEAARGMTPGEGARATDGLPSEEEFERTIGYMERFMRSFMGIVEEFQGDEPAGGQTR